MQATRAATAQWSERLVRARFLAGSQPWAGEVLRLYTAIAAVQERAFEAALSSPPEAARLAEHVAAGVMPEIVAATVANGPAPLAGAVLARFNEARLESIIEAWLTGAEQPATETFLARASTSPLLEADPALAGAWRLEGEAANRCPVCAGLPQLSWFGVSGEALVTGPRYLACSRCTCAWVYPRLVCAGCGEEDSKKLSVLADAERFPGVRVDACDSCRRYLLTVDMPKDPDAVPLVDELAALPLDLHAKELGLKKVTPNLMGF